MFWGFFARHYYISNKRTKRFLNQDFLEIQRMCLDKHLDVLRHTPIITRIKALCKKYVNQAHNYARLSLYQWTRTRVCQTLIRTLNCVWKKMARISGIFSCFFLSHHRSKTIPKCMPTQQHLKLITLQQLSKLTKNLNQ